MAPRSWDNFEAMMRWNRPVLLRFGPNELNPVSFELRRSNKKVRLAARPMELLLLLASRRGELITREEIGRSSWPESNVDDLDARINTAIAQIRGALNDDPAKPRYLETVISKGYRFTATIEEIELTDPPPIAPVETPMPDAYAPEVVNLQALLPNKPNKPHHAVYAAFTLLLAAVVFFLIRWDRKPAPPLQGSEVTSNGGETPVLGGSLSGDGRLLAYADIDGFHIKELQTGKTRDLPAGDFRVTHLSWFPDGARLLVNGLNSAGSKPEIWIVFTQQPLLPYLFRTGAENGSLSPDGKTIAFTLKKNRDVWLAGIDGNNARVLIHGAPDESFPSIFWSGDGTRINYQRRRFSPHSGPVGIDLETNYEWSYGSTAIASGGETASVKGIRFDEAVESASGQIFYLRETPSTDFAHRGLWTMRTDQASGNPVEPPRRLTSSGREVVAGISVSRDGKQLAAVVNREQADVFTASLHFPGPTLDAVQRLTSDIQLDFPHAWAPGSDAVYFESNRAGDGHFHLYRQRLGSHAAEMLTAGDSGEILADLTSDGRNLLFDGRRQNGRAIFRANTNGTDSSLLLKENELDEWRCALRSPVCVVRQTEGNRQFIFYNLDLKSGRGAELARAAWQPTIFWDWSLSPDGKVAALPNHEPGAPAIRLVRLDGQAPQQTEIKVHQAARLWGIHWSADATGFFAEARTSAVHNLEFIGLDGEPHLLRQTADNTWGVPSPDGTKLAFPDFSVDKNIWIWR